MIFTTVDFENLKNNIDNEFNGKFNTTEEFETYIKEKLQIKNINFFIEEVVRAENIIFGKERDNKIKNYPLSQLILKANFSKNGNNLSTWKNNDKTLRYL